MLRVIYTGPTRDVGRFGICRKGDELRMMFHEVLYTAMHHPQHWSLIDKLERVPDGHDVLPLGNPIFDLRAMNYLDFDRLLPALDGTPLEKLKRIASAINFVGGYVCLHRDINRTEMADAICYNVWRFSWDKLDRDQCHALPEIDKPRTPWDTREEGKAEAAKQPTRRRRRKKATAKQ